MAAQARGLTSGGSLTLAGDQLYEAPDVAN